MVVNEVAIIFAALVSLLLGIIWYSPILFGKIWQRESGLSQEKIKSLRKRHMFNLYAVNLAMLLIMAFILAHFRIYLTAGTILESIRVAALIWLGFVATTLLNAVIWQNKSFKAYLIEASYHLASLILMAILLVSWP